MIDTNCMFDLDKTNHWHFKSNLLMTWCWIIDDLSTVFTVWAWDYWGSDRVNERTGGQLAPKICKFLLLLYNQMLWCNCELEQRSVSQKLLPKSCKSKLVPKSWKSTSLKTSQLSNCTPRKAPKLRQIRYFNRMELRWMDTSSGGQG